MRTPTHQLDLKTPPLGRADLCDMLRVMLLSRELDEAELRLFRQQRCFFTISGAGHEAIQVAVARALQPGRDWFFPYYRDRALCLGLGMSPEAMLLQALGSSDDPSSGGRQMPAHWGDPQLRIVSLSSPTGTQFLQAVGVAEGARIARSLPLPLDDRAGNDPGELVFVSSGDGATSEGEFYEAVCAAALARLPVLFLVEDNGYAISVPVETQTPGGSISKLLAEVPGLKVVETDGLDPIRSYRDVADAVASIRAGGGPVLMHAHVVRLWAHSNSDDHSDYRASGELSRLRSEDPIRLFEAALERQGVLTRGALDTLRDEVRKEVAGAVDIALASPLPDPRTVGEHLFAPQPQPELLEVSSEVSARVRSRARVHTADIGPARELTMVEAIRVTLSREMSRDPRIVVFGQDVADTSSSDLLGEVKGKGGVFKVTAGLQRRFGDKRVFNSQLAEASIVGRALGMSLRGLRPVVEIQFFDYIWPAMMQLRNELALLRWRSNGAFAAPVVVRVPIGGYLRGGAIYHSQTGESIFCHCPGLRVVMPSNAADAAGLLRAAIRSDDPVLFLEHKHLYRQPSTRSVDPGDEHLVHIGAASVVREGTDVTLVTWGAVVSRALVAAETMRRRGIQVEVVDLRSLQPWDFETVAASTRKTSRLVVASEEPGEFGVAAEIAARVGEELFLDLDAPITRVTSKFLPVGYHPRLEEEILVQTDDIVDALDAIARF